MSRKKGFFVLWSTYYYQNKNNEFKQTFKKKGETSNVTACKGRIWWKTGLQTDWWDGNVSQQQTRNDGVYKIPCFLLFAVKLDQQTEKQRGQGGIWIIIFTFECMFDISLFIQGEYMALKLDFVWSRQAIWGLSRAVVRSNLVIWNFSSPSFTEVHVKSPVLYEEKDCL